MLNMRAGVAAFALFAGVAHAPPAGAAEKRIDLSDYQSFVKNWSPPESPLCAAMQSKADWDAVMAPAATMGQTRPFSPPEAFWKRNGLLLLARVIDSGGDAMRVFEVTRVQRTQSQITVEYTFHAPPAASSQIKEALALQFAKPAPTVIEFKQDGAVFCTLHPNAKQFVSPAPAAN